jgi:uncharacterized protein (DUF58 family)
MKINFAKLNHVLIPSTKPARDRLRKGLFGPLIRPFGAFYDGLTAEGRAVFLLSFIIGGFGIDVHGSDVHVLWSALAALLAGTLVATRFHAIAPFRIEVVAPRRVTIGDVITFTLVLHNDGAVDRHALRVLGPFLPWDGRWTVPSPRVPGLAAGAQVRLEARARFLERGEHHLDPFQVAALVPLGLTLGPSVSSAGVRFLVVPKIASVVRLTTPAGRRHQPGGVALASKTGESMDLLGVRPYRAGDPVRHLHARSWARTGTPMVREYQEEYFSRIGVVVDTAVPSEERLEAMLSLAAGVVAHLARGEALIDLLVAGDRVHDLTLGRHLGFLEQALDLLACVEARSTPLGADAVLSVLSPHLPRLSCVIVVTSKSDDGALAERIRGSGVGCTTLVVIGDEPEARGRDVRSIRASAITAGEALSL